MLILLLLFHSTLAVTLNSNLGPIRGSRLLSIPSKRPFSAFYGLKYAQIGGRLDESVLNDQFVDENATVEVLMDKGTDLQVI